jgi:succinate dehydrogenase / fumarate reductase membrane anchor subunit
MKHLLNGLRGWVLQRFTAIYILLFSLYIVLHFQLNGAHDYGAWREFITGPVVSIAFLVCLLAIMLHAWIGIRDAVLDYVNGFWLRLVVLALLALYLLVMMTWAIRAVTMTVS